MIGFIHHATFRVADVAEAVERWTTLFGLTVREQSADHALLRCAYEDYCLELRRSGGAPGIEHVAYELQAGVMLDAARERLTAAGTAFQEEPVPYGRGTGLRVEDPDGNGVLVVERRPPADRRPAVAQLSTELRSPFHPRKLGHVNYLTADVGRMVEWYGRVLGFEVTDWIGDGAVWLHVNRDHHVLAFLDKGYAHLHHVAFEFVDFGEIRMLLDHLGQHGRWCTWGPGRHSMAQNLFTYIRMWEEEVFVECFSDLEQLDADHQPRHFPDDAHSSNAWGQLPPRTYFKFDAESIRVEREQLHALHDVTVA
jgi:catechol-2,3-dioxygenase